MKKKIFYTALFISLLLIQNIAFASYKNFEVEAFDTIAGFDSLVKISNVSQGQEFLIKISSPENTSMKLIGRVPESGIFRREIPGSLLTEAGLYAVSVFENGQFIGESEFSVYPDEPFGRGGDFGETSLLSLADVSSISAFEIRNLPTGIPANQTTSFTVRAVDASRSLVRSYLGTVHFSSPLDPNALVPANYTFQPSDLGEHTFQLSLSFRAEGQQKIVVTEVDNEDIRGEAAILVTASRTQSSSATLEITSPAEGRYGVNVLQIQGQADPNVSVNILDNSQRIGSTRASSSGAFSYTTPVLSDGEHRFTVQSGAQTSDEVAVTIDATASALGGFELSKNPAGPGETIEVTVRTDAGLESVSVVLADLLIDLSEDTQNPGTYKGEIVAPNDAGNYPIDVRTLDFNGNEGLFTEAATLRVDENVSSRVSFRVPSRIANVEAVPGNGKVTLSWTPAQDDTGIAYYRIYYGTHPSNLNRAANTADARTEWYVPNLVPRVQYFFQIVGVDNDGNEGNQRSSVVSAVVLGTPGQTYVDSQTNFGDLGNAGGRAAPPENLPEDGPEMLYFVILSPLLAFVILKKRKSSAL